MFPFWMGLSAALALTPPKPAVLDTNGQVVLDGVLTDVRWDDGDTFMVPTTGLKARLDGYNTLESYGAVHRFGPGEVELFALSSKATDMARSTAWKCTVQEGSGGYGRSRVDCPGLRKALLEAGFAHAFVVKGKAPEADLLAQKVGMDAAVGMWSKGVPSGIITSVHSIDEKPGQTSTYNRILDPLTGVASKHSHTNTYAACEWVCMDDSCLLYVPYAQRYGSDRAECLEPAP